MTPSDFEHWLTDAQRSPLVMGVLNVTPDSFSDGGRFNSPEAAADAALAMIRDGADCIDIGGESTRPGAIPVPEPEQIQRTIPVIAALRKQTDVLLSIDTRQGGVAKIALEAGANIVNDISAGRDDPVLMDVAARHSAAIILMHMQGSPETMQMNPVYQDVTQEVSEFLNARVSAGIAAGIAKHRILVDPGLGFGKTKAHNLKLLKEISRLVAIGQPLVVGPSRKRFIGDILGEERADRRLFGTAGAVAWCVGHGAAMVRVHDPGPISQIVRVIRAIIDEK